MKGKKCGMNTPVIGKQVPKGVVYKPNKNGMAKKIKKKGN